MKNELPINSIIGENIYSASHGAWEKRERKKFN
jgi:hypothetical protein